MLKRIENRLTRTAVRAAVKTARLLGMTVRQDRGSADRYFIQRSKGNKHYILSHRKKKYRTGTSEGDTFKQYHLGFVSFYREVGNRYMWDVQQRDMG